ncbi:MAG TPA: LacI family DNA-binding transcriptional regulator [Bacilli bacterium]|nr:LacI family DNA-binding transcriptional regulator [Bacilli bacterium]
MVNIKDVAKACNVSSATASRALSGDGYVKKSKREMILKKAEELGYIVDSHAKSLKSGRSNTIGVIVSDIGNYFYNIVLEKLIVEFKNRGYNVLLAYSFENSQYERQNIKSMLSYKVDALIFTPVSNSNADLISIMGKRNIKILQLFRQAYENVDALCVDDEYGAYLATSHLLNHGKKRILLFSVKLDYTPNRSNGYIRALHEANMTVDDSLIRLYPLGHSIETEIEKLLIEIKPDAIIAGTNNFGLDALMALKKLNLDISTIVFDDLEWFQLLNVTTIAQPIDEIFQKTVANIMGKIDNPEAEQISQCIKVEPQLNIRESSTK